jgi:hypothetical protein
MSARTFQAQTPLEALLVEHALAIARQLQATADAAPDGHVLAQVEAAALPAGREFTRRAVAAALQAQAAAAEKKGRPAGCASAAAGPSGPSVPPSAAS